jgi:hypothetical protein
MKNQRVMWVLAIALLPALLSASAAEPVAFPTKAKPWKREGQTNECIALEKSLRALMALPAEQVQSHPAAADFPGRPPVEAKAVTRKLSVDTRISRWHSTGLYAVPGQVITVTVPADATTARLGVRIGCHQDRLWNPKIKSWSRVPEITRRFPLQAPVTSAANAFGGPVYIEVPSDCPLGIIEVTVAGAVPAPMFELGRTDLAAWINDIRNAPGPWAELAGRKLIISLPSENVRQLDDPAAVVEFWDRVVSAQDELAGITNRTSPERFVLDRQISAGYMHSGYPIMAHLDQQKKVADMAELRKGNWGFFHELGHNHQRPDWTPAGTGEVTCNIFSMYCFDRVCGLPRRGHGAMADAKREKALREFFTDTSKVWTSDAFLALNFYDQLVEGFGWEPFRQVFAEYRDLPKPERPKSNEEKLDQWLVRFSRATGKNLGPFFAAWRIPVSEAACQVVQHLPAWQPDADFPKQYQAQ